MTATLPPQTTGAATAAAEHRLAGRGTVAERPDAAAAPAARTRPAGPGAGLGRVGVGPPSSPTTIVVESPERPPPDALRARRARAQPGLRGRRPDARGRHLRPARVRDHLGAASDHVEVGLGWKDVAGADPHGAPARRRRTCRSPPPPEEARLTAGATRPPGTAPPSPTTTTSATTSTGSSSARAMTYSCAHWSVARPPRSRRPRRPSTSWSARKLGLQPGHAPARRRLRLGRHGAPRGRAPRRAASSASRSRKEQAAWPRERVAEAGPGRPGRDPRAGLPRRRRRAVRRDQSASACSSTSARPAPPSTSAPRPLARAPRRPAAQPRHLPPARRRRRSTTARSSAATCSPTASCMEVGKTVSAMQRGRVRGARRRVAPRALRAHPAGAGSPTSRRTGTTRVRLVGPGRARVWRLYMAASAVNFEQGRTSLHQVLGVRPHADGRADMPLTRRELLGALTSPPPVPA